MNIPNHKLAWVVRGFYEAEAENEAVDWEAAPSGEFNEYNAVKLELCAREESLYLVIKSLGFEPEQLARALGLEK